jgi:hypothetical protein
MSETPVEYALFVARSGARVGVASELELFDIEDARLAAQIHANGLRQPIEIWATRDHSNSGRRFFYVDTVRPK